MTSLYPALIFPANGCALGPILHNSIIPLIKRLRPTIRQPHIGGLLTILIRSRILPTVELMVVIAWYMNDPVNIQSMSPTLAIKIDYLLILESVQVKTSDKL